MLHVTLHVHFIYRIKGSRLELTISVGLGKKCCSIRGNWSLPSLRCICRRAAKTLGRSWGIDFESIFGRKSSWRGRQSPKVQNDDHESSPTPRLPSKSQIQMTKITIGQLHWLLRVLKVICYENNCSEACGEISWNSSACGRWWRIKVSLLGTVISCWGNWCSVLRQTWTLAKWIDSLRKEKESVA